MSLSPVIRDEARAIHESALVFDLHCDTMLSQALLGYDPKRRHRNLLPGSPFLYQADIPRMRDGGVGAVALGIVVNPLRVKTASRATWRYLDMLRAWEADSPGDVALISSAADIVAARASGKIAVFGGIEGAHALGGRLDELEAMRDAGLRYIGLSHFSKNQAAFPSFGWGAAPDKPLTDFGRELVAEMNRLHILVDLAHISRAGHMEVCARSEVPVIVSHTGLRAVHDVWRNIDDEQIRAVSKTGGVVAVIFAPIFHGGGLMGSIRSIVKSIQHVIDVAGEDHVALGTDLDGFVLLPPDFPDISAMPFVTQCMLDAGLKERQIRKCLGENSLRVFQDVCG